MLYRWASGDWATLFLIVFPDLFEPIHRQDERQNSPKQYVVVACAATCIYLPHPALVAWRYYERYIATRDLGAFYLCVLVCACRIRYKLFHASCLNAFVHLDIGTAYYGQGRINSLKLGYFFSPSRWRIYYVDLYRRPVYIYALGRVSLETTDPGAVLGSLSFSLYTLVHLLLVSIMLLEALLRSNSNSIPRHSKNSKLVADDASINTFKDERERQKVSSETKDTHCVDIMREREPET